MSLSGFTVRNDLAFVFPGQGSQSVGMLADLSDAYSSVAETFAAASTVLGIDLWDLIANGPVDELNLTQNTQPAMLCAGVALWRVWLKRGGPRPGFMAGHSLGEYTALTCSGALAFEDAVRLVATRGRLMQEAVPAGQGGMAAILGLEEAQLERVCEQAAEDQVVATANYNSPGQLVIAGHAQAVERAVALAKQAGAKRALPLAVSGPFHCSLMAPAADRLRQSLEAVDIVVPQIPVIQNADVESYEDPDEIRAALIRQLSNPVRWSATIIEVMQRGAATVAECGPGKVLAGLNRRIDRKLGSLALHDAASIDAGLNTLRGDVS